MSKTNFVAKMARRAGFLRPRDLDAHKIPRQYLRLASKQGLIMRVGRGLYVAASAQATTHHSLAMATKRVPKGIICLLSALRFHDLTTQAPFEVWIAIDRKARRPSANQPPLRIVRFPKISIQHAVRTYRLKECPSKFSVLQRRWRTASNIETRSALMLLLKPCAIACGSARQPWTTFGKRLKFAAFLA